MAEAYTVALSAQPQRKEVSTRFEVHINQHQAEVQDGWEVSNRQVAKSAVSVDAHLIDIMHICVCVCVITSLAHEMTHQTRKCINYVPWNPPFFCMEALLFVCVESTFELERIRYTEATIFTYN